MSGLTRQTKPRRVTRRRRALRSQQQVTNRLRETFAQGFGLYPIGLRDTDIDKVRVAVRELAHDGAFWNGLKTLQQMKKPVEDLTKKLEMPGFQLPEES